MSGDRERDEGTAPGEGRELKNAGNRGEEEVCGCDERRRAVGWCDRGRHGGQGKMETGDSPWQPQKGKAERERRNYISFIVFKHLNDFSHTFVDKVELVWSSFEQL